MEILNFVPLLIWALGYLCLMEFSVKWMTTHFNWDEKKYDEYMNEHGDSLAKLWLSGVVVFFLLGLMCLID